MLYLQHKEKGTLMVPENVTLFSTNKLRKISCFTITDFNFGNVLWSWLSSPFALTFSYFFPCMNYFTLFHHQTFSPCYWKHANIHPVPNGWQVTLWRFLELVNSRLSMIPLCLLHWFHKMRYTVHLLDFLTKFRSSFSRDSSSLDMTCSL